MYCHALFYVGLGMEHRASCTLDKPSATRFLRQGLSLVSEAKLGSQWAPVCVCLPSAEITRVHHHSQRFYNVGFRAIKHALVFAQHSLCELSHLSTLTSTFSSSCFYFPSGDLNSWYSCFSPPGGGCYRPGLVYTVQWQFLVSAVTGLISWSQWGQNYGRRRLWDALQ